MLDTLYLCDECPLSTFIRVICKFCQKAPIIESSNSLNKKSQSKLLTYSPINSLPLLKNDDNFYISGVLPIVNYILSFNPETKTTLIGNGIKQQAQYEMWTSYFITNLVPIVEDMIKQLYGMKQYDQESFEKQLIELMNVLNIINKHLMMKAFFIGHSIGVVDLMFCAILFKLYSCVITPDLREKVPHVIRHFKYLSQLEEVKQLFGEAVACVERMKPIQKEEKK